MDCTPETDRILLGMDEVELRAMIRERAYELAQIRQASGQEGSPEEDWRQAAAEIQPFVVVEDHVA